MKAKKIGRPTKYTPELAEEICNAIATSSDGLKKLCKLNSHWPCKNTIMGWRNKVPDFMTRYARAKQDQIESLIDEILEIADNKSEDYVQNEDGKFVVNHENINRAKLRIDTRKWLAAKLAPRIYGDKPEILAIAASSNNLDSVRELTERYLGELKNQDECCQVV
jgi:hypothetical protein